MNLREELKAYVDGELNESQAREVERATESSPEVRAELDALRTLTEEFRALQASPAPIGKDALLRRLRQAAPSPSKRFRGWIWLGSAAAVLLALPVVFPVFAQSRRALTVGRAEETVAQSAPAREERAERAPGFGADAEQKRSEKAVASESPSPVLPNIPPNSGRDIIYNGSIRLEVPDVSKSVQEAIGLIQGLGGYVVSTESNLDGAGMATAYLEVRVPASRFDTANKSLAKFGKILSQNSSGQDVTAEIARAEGRARSLAAAEQEYIRMLNATRNVSARLEVRRRLDEVRAERESLKAELTRMKDLAALSNLTIQFQGEKVVRPDQTSENWWNDSVTGAGNALGMVGRVVGRLAIYLIYLSPLWLAGLAIWWVARRMRF